MAMASAPMCIFGSSQLGTGLLAARDVACTRGAALPRTAVRSVLRPAFHVPGRRDSGLPSSEAAPTIRSTSIAGTVIAGAGLLGVRRSLGGQDPTRSAVTAAWAVRKKKKLKRVKSPKRRKKPAPAEPTDLDDKSLAGYDEDLMDVEGDFLEPAPDYSNQFGSLQPLGFWDPLKISERVTDVGYRNLRVAEIKHGRVAMLATIGSVFEHYVRFPGLEGTKGGVGALLQQSVLTPLAWLVGICGVIEIFYWAEEEDREPGDYGDPLGLDMYTDDMRLKELSNGRMAMISIAGIIAAELATGKDAAQQLGLPDKLSQLGLPAVANSQARAGRASILTGFTAPPATVHRRGALAAAAAKARDPPVAAKAKKRKKKAKPPKFEVPKVKPWDPADQPGAVAPLGYFDPLTICQLSDKKTFRQVRAAELKHGRVAMLAAIGAVVQHFVTLPSLPKYPGTFGILRFDGVYPLFALIVALCGVLEQFLVEKPGAEPGDFGDPAGLGMYTRDMRDKELNNGRMAMLSILGIFAAEVATGKDAVQQLQFS